MSTEFSILVGGKNGGNLATTRKAQGGRICSTPIHSVQTIRSGGFRSQVRVGCACRYLVGRVVEPRSGQPQLIAEAKRRVLRRNLGERRLRRNASRDDKTDGYMYIFSALPSRLTLGLTIRRAPFPYSAQCYHVPAMAHSARSNWSRTSRANAKGLFGSQRGSGVAGKP